MVKDSTEYRSVKQVAEALAISRVYVNKLILEGKIDALKVGETYIIPIEVVRREKKKMLEKAEKRISQLKRVE